MSFKLTYVNDETGKVTEDYQSDRVIVNGNCGNFTNSMKKLKLNGVCTVENLDSSGEVIPADPPEGTVTKGYKFTYVLNNWRAVKKLPFFVTSKLKGIAATKVEHITEGTDSLGGEFSVTFNGEAVTM
jgi:hypothetical protein